MKVKIRYKSGRLDVFDTDTFTKSEPFPGTNMLTDFELELDTPREKGIWLSAHMYETGQVDDEDANETPVARRRRGWCFLLAECGEVDDIESVRVDDDVVLQRIFGELVDVLKVDELAKAWITNSESMSTADKILVLFDIAPDADDAIDAEERAEMCGCTFTLIKALHAMRKEKDDSDAVPEDDEDWMEGLENEDIN